MLNTKQIVPVQKTDLLTLYGTVLNIANISAEALTGANGVYQVKTNNKVYIADAPVKSLDFDATASSVTAGTVYFVAAYDFEGFTVNGVATETAGADIEADGRSLYKAVLADGTITITQVGF